MSHGCQTPPFVIKQNEEEKGQEDRGGDEAILYYNPTGIQWYHILTQYIRPKFEKIPKTASEMLLATYDVARLTEVRSSHNHFKIKSKNFKLLPLFYDELWVTHTHTHTHTHTCPFSYYTDSWHLKITPYFNFRWHVTTVKNIFYCLH